MNIKNGLTIKEAINLLKNREVSCKELFANYLKKIKKENPKLNVYLDIFDDLTEKGKINSFLKENEFLSKDTFQIHLLYGIPCAIKDNILPAQRS